MNTQKQPLKISCPGCKSELTWDENNHYRPFCSERCRQLDFCGWANEEKVLKGQSLYDDIFSEDLGQE